MSNRNPVNRRNNSICVCISYVFANDNSNIMIDNNCQKLSNWFKQLKKLSQLAEDKCRCSVVTKQAIYGL